MAPNRKRRGKRLPPSSAGSITPTLSLSTTSVALAATAGDTATVQVVVTGQSGNGGALGGVGIGTIVENSGSGWLSASVQGSFPALITIVCDPTGLSAASYTGTVQITDPRASNSPRTVSVAFTVAAVAAPTIVLSNPTMTLSVQQGNAATASATCLVTSGTATALGALSVGTVTGTGSTGVTAAIVGNTITVTGASAALTNASSPYTATVPIIDATASNTPQNITVTLNVAAVSPPATPTMALSASAVSLSAVQGSGAVASTTVTVSSANGATLGTTSVGTITGTGAAAVTTSVSGHVVTISAAVGSLAVAAYSATIPILDSAASNSPLDVTLTFNVTAQPVGTTIPAAIYLFGDTAGANVLVSAVFPLRPGDLTVADATANKFRVYVSGVEQAIYAEPLRGCHTDGTVRAMLVQFRYDVPNTTPITASVVLGSARGTTDLTKTPVTQGVTWMMGQAPYGVRAKLLPTTPSYLCATLVAGSPLVPAAQVDSLSYPLFVAYMDNRYEAIKNIETTSTSAQSDYEHIRGLVAAWCMTGDTKYYQSALSRMRYFYTYNNDTNPPSYTPTHNVENVTPYGAGAGGSGEPKSQRQWTWFVGYYTTGWPNFYATANALGQIGMRAATSYTYARPIAAAIGGTSRNHSPRAIMRTTPGMWIAALMDATRSVISPSGGAVSASGYQTQFAKIWTDVAAGKYVESSGGTGWRSGFPFHVQTYQDDAGGAVLGDWPLFQSALIARHMIDYYLMVHAHPDIPPYLKLMVDTIYLNSASTSGNASGTGSDLASAVVGGVTYTFLQPRWGLPYLAKATPTPDSQVWTFPMWAPAIAFVHKYYGGNDPGGTPYLTWYARCVNLANMYHQGGGTGAASGWSWKIWAETFGGTQIASYLMSLTGPPQGPASPRTPTLYTDWPT